MKQALKITIVALLLLIIASFFFFDLGQYLNLEYLKSQQESLHQFKQNNFFLVALGFFIIYVIATGASLPGAAVLTLAAGALFGLTIGTLLVSFASTLGATLAFLSARFLLRDWVQEKFSARLNKINAELEKDGNFYLFTLRLIPAFPFFVINLTMGLTPIKTLNYMWVSQLGMLPGTIAYVNAGTALADVKTMGDIISPSFIISFALLGILPLALKKSLPLLEKLFKKGA